MARVEFECFGIETAPKDRKIMLLEYGEWSVGRWMGIHSQFWARDRRPIVWATHWAELKDMVPKEEA